MKKVNYYIKIPVVTKKGSTLVLKKVSTVKGIEEFLPKNDAIMRQIRINSARILNNQEPLPIENNLGKERFMKLLEMLAKQQMLSVPKGVNNIEIFDSLKRGAKPFVTLNKN